MSRVPDLVIPRQNVPLWLQLSRNPRNVKRVPCLKLPFAQTSSPPCFLIYRKGSFAVIFFFFLVKRIRVRLKKLSKWLFSETSFNEVLSFRVISIRDFFCGGGFDLIRGYLITVAWFGGFIGGVFGKVRFCEVSDDDFEKVNSFDSNNNASIVISF